jgi:acylphosphatase
VHATGDGTVEVDAMNEDGKVLQSYVLTIESDEGDDAIPVTTLSQQYERKFEHRYRGLQLRFRLKGKGLVRIVGFAVIVTRN